VARVALAILLAVSGFSSAGGRAPETRAPQPAHGAEAPRRDLKVGNLFGDAPYGIAIIVDGRTGFLIDPDWDPRGGKTHYSERDAALVAPATTAPDFSFSEAVFRHAGARVTWTWGRVGADAVAAVLRTDRTVTMSPRLPTRRGRSSTRPIGPPRTR
jgi:hypothetical protein